MSHGWAVWSMKLRFIECDSLFLQMLVTMLIFPFSYKEIATEHICMFGGGMPPDGKWPHSRIDT